MQRWPNFFIVGAPKAGTSSLYAYLNEIPGIFMSPVKEPNFFSRSTFSDDHSLKPIRDEKKYLELFKGVKDEKIIGEASPSYLADPEAPNLIHENCPDAKILISLRNPVERTFSNYLMLKRVGTLKSSFLQELKISLNDEKNDIKNKLILKRGLFFNNVKKYIETFDTKNVKIIFFEDLIKDEIKTIEEIIKFLSIDYSIKDFKHEIFNEYGVVRGPFAKFILKNITLRRIAEKFISPSRRKKLKEKVILKNEPKPIMDTSSREILVKYYNDDVQKLKELLGRDFPWKDF